MEVDFSQLEVVALAVLSGDPVLRQDIIDGVDMHTVRAADLFGVSQASVSPKQRQLAKQLSFQLQYGAGAKSMAEKNGIPKTLAEKFIKQYYDRYPVVAEWQAQVREEVKASRTPSERRTASGKPAGVGEHRSRTGRLYKFFEYDVSWSGDVGFSPTEMKNYPVQGFATGDIMALYRGMVYRRLLREDPEVQDAVKLINTVHDSIMLDVAEVGVVGYVYELMREECWKLPAEISRRWGIDVDVPFRIECKYGPNWGDMRKFSY